MKIHRLFVAVAVFSLSTSVDAQEPSQSLLLPSEIAEIAGNAYTNYAVGGVKMMLSAERQCWAEVEGDKYMAAACTAGAVAGSFIEAAVARGELRGAHGDYTGAAVRARILAESTLSEADVNDVLEHTVVANTDAIMGGLAAAGMP